MVLLIALLNSWKYACEVYSVNGKTGNKFFTNRLKKYQWYYIIELYNKLLSITGYNRKSFRLTSQRLYTWTSAWSDFFINFKKPMKILLFVISDWYYIRMIMNVWQNDFLRHNEFRIELNWCNTATTRIFIIFR